MADFDSVIKNAVAKFHRQKLTESVKHISTGKKSNLHSFFEQVILCRYKDKYIFADRGIYRSHKDDWYIKIYVADKNKTPIKDSNIYILNADSQAKSWYGIYMTKDYQEDKKAFKTYKYLTDTDYLNYLCRSNLDIWFDLNESTLRSCDDVVGVLGKDSEKVFPVLVWICLDYIKPFLSGLLIETYEKFKNDKGLGTNS